MPNPRPHPNLLGMQIDIYSDTVCPWCFIGKRRLEKAMASRPELDLDIVWRPFQLNPNMPAGGMDRQAYLANKFGGAQRAGQFYDLIDRAGRGDGLDFQFQRINVTPNSLDSHRLIKFGRAAGRQDPIVEALFRAYFLDGWDIGEMDVLVEVAEACGLDGASTRAFLESDQDVQQTKSEDLKARRMGIDGVPFFVVNRKYAVAGAQEAEAFLPLFDLKDGETPDGA